MTIQAIYPGATGRQMRGRMIPRIDLHGLNVEFSINTYAGRLPVAKGRGLP